MNLARRQALLAAKQNAKRKSRVFIQKDGSVVFTDYWKSKNKSDDIQIPAEAFDGIFKDNHIYLTQWGQLHGEERVIDHGQGVFALYIHGCQVRCQTCYQPEFFNEAPKWQINIETLVESLLQQEDKIRNQHGVLELISAHAPKSLIQLINSLRESGFNVPIAYKFAGVLSTQTINELAPQVQYWIPDLKAISKDLSNYHGLPESFPAANLRTIQNLARLTNSTLIIRHLIVPNFTHCWSELSAICNFLTLLNRSDLYLSVLTEYMNVKTNSVEFADHEMLQKVINNFNLNCVVHHGVNI